MSLARYRTSPLYYKLSKTTAEHKGFEPSPLLHGLVFKTSAANRICLYSIIFKPSITLGFSCIAMLHNIMISDKNFYHFENRDADGNRTRVLPTLKGWLPLTSRATAPYVCYFTVTNRPFFYVLGFTRGSSGC